MVVEIVTECLDVGYGIGTFLWKEVAWEED